MPDRRELIASLEGRICGGEMHKGGYIHVPQKEAEAILELLKGQEPVEPIPPTDESDLWRCGNCNHQLFKCTHQRYCEMCGREVKWDE